jgi:hypothetical protein
MKYIDENSDYYQLLLRYITYEQIGLLKRGAEALRDLNVTSIIPELLTEGI